MEATSQQEVSRCCEKSPPEWHGFNLITPDWPWTRSVRVLQAWFQETADVLSQISSSGFQSRTATGPSQEARLASADLWTSDFHASSGLGPSWRGPNSGRFLCEMTSSPPSVLNAASLEHTETLNWASTPVAMTSSAHRKHGGAPRWHHVTGLQTKHTCSTSSSSDWWEIF